MDFVNGLSGLTVLVEYHYSGFGVTDAEDVLAQPSFQERFLRGDTQILSRHAAAVQGTYPISADLTGAVLVLQSPTDGSGVGSPSLTWNASDSATVTAIGFVPWGAGPSGGNLRSHYGARPWSLFMQLALYF